MTEEQIALARRAVACKGWRWMDGMCFGEPIGRDVVMRRRFDANKETPPIGSVPILDDPATLGCLLALVREAWGQDDMGAFRYKDLWCVEFTPSAAKNHAFYGETEAEALVAALEDAP